MKTLINKLSAGILIIGFLGLTSCASDFLDTAPTNSAEISEVIGSTSNAMKALNGISKIMTTQQYYFGQGFAGENNIMAQYENYPSENYLYNYYAPGWSPIMNQEFHSRTTSIYDAYAWYYYYTLIGNANTIICNIDNATGSDDEKKFIKASALTFRAYAFEKLVHYYCWRWQDSNNGASQGLILRLDESTGGMPYSTLAQTYEQIYKDLDDAITLFSGTKTKRAASDVWIPNENVAHAVYARAALTKQDYAKALSEAKLARAGFPLMDNTAYHSGFCNPTSEWIFGSYGGAQENNWYYSYGTSYACNGYYASKNTTGGGAIGRELINRIPNNDARKALFLTEDKFPGYNFNDNSAMDVTYGILGLGEDEEAADALWEEAAAYCAKMAVGGLDAPYQAGYMYLGGHLKFHVFDLPGVGYLPFIRSSEMVLIEAEANYQLNDETAAIASLVELNKTSGRNPEYACTKSGDDLWNEIMDYRELELWGEGFGWSDYKRWNRPVIRKGFKEGGNAHTTIATTIPADGVNKWTWDVPQNEIDYNDDLK